MDKEKIKQIMGERLSNRIHVLNFRMKLYSYWRKPIQNNKILFDNFAGKGYGGNSKYIAELLLKEKGKYDLVWIVDDDKKYEFPNGIRTVLKESEEYFRELATAKIWIDNVRKESYIQKRGGQYYIQLWHGYSPIKKIEFDIKKELEKEYIWSAKHDSKMIDLFISGNALFSSMLKFTFRYNGEVGNYGCVGNDIFWNDQSDVYEKVKSIVGYDVNSKIVLYVPTFRNHFDEEDYAINWKKICNTLEKRYNEPFVFFRRLHPNVKSRLIEENGMYDVSDYEDIQELLKIADVLITDYSSCMYDFSLMNKPVFLLQPDKERYMEERPLYSDKMIFPTAESEEELLYLLENYCLEEDYELKQALKKINFYDDGHACERVVNRIKEQL